MCIVYVLKYIKQTSRDKISEKRENVREYHLSRLITAIIYIYSMIIKLDNVSWHSEGKEEEEENRHALNNRVVCRMKYCVREFCLRFPFFFISTIAIAVLVSIIKREQKGTLEYLN